MLSEIIARSSVYVVVVHMEVDVLKWYHVLFFSSHLSSGYKNKINKYEFRVSPCMVPRPIVIGSVVPK